MAIKLPFKIDGKTIALLLSVLLNILGGTSQVKPLVGDYSELECPPAPAPAPVPSLEAEPILNPTPSLKLN